MVTISYVSGGNPPKFGPVGRTNRDQYEDSKNVHTNRSNTKNNLRRVLQSRIIWPQVNNKVNRRRRHCDFSPHTIILKRNVSVDLITFSYHMADAISENIIFHIALSANRYLSLCINHKCHIVVYQRAHGR